MEALADYLRATVIIFALQCFWETPPPPLAVQNVIIDASYGSDDKHSEVVN